MKFPYFQYGKSFVRKTISTGSVLALLGVTTLLPGKAFAQSEFLQYANRLVEAWVINSQPNEMGYRFWDNITRAEMAKIAVLLGLGEPSKCSGSVFQDVNSWLGDLCWYVEAAADMGIVSNANTMFRPHDNVTRAEMVKMLLAATGIAPSMTSAGFSDVNASIGDLEWYVNAAVEEGIINKWAAFSPNRTSSRWEAFKVAANVADFFDFTTPTWTGTTGTWTTGTWMTGTGTTGTWTTWTGTSGTWTTWTGNETGTWTTGTWMTGTGTTGTWTTWTGTSGTWTGNETGTWTTGTGTTGTWTGNGTGTGTTWTGTTGNWTTGTWAVTNTSFVTIAGNAFNPANISVKKGTWVTWRNDDTVQHDVSSSGSSTMYFSSPPLNQNDSYSYLFSNPGTYEYICSIHPNMKWSVTVTE